MIFDIWSVKIYLIYELNVINVKFWSFFSFCSIFSLTFDSYFLLDETNIESLYVVHVWVEPFAQLDSSYELLFSESF